MKTNAQSMAASSPSHTGEARDNRETPVSPKRDCVSPTSDFDAGKLVSKPMCVAWIDIMGSKNAMLHSLKTAANFVAKLHSDIEKIRNKLNIHIENRDQLEVFRMMDGAYIVSPNAGVVFALVRNVMRRCAIRFLEEQNPLQKSIVRAAVAWGNVVTGDALTECMKTTEWTPPNGMMNNVMVGMPFVWSHEGEHQAPPFGIFVDVSVREHTQYDSGIVVPALDLAVPFPEYHKQKFFDVLDSSIRIGWVLDRWWGEKAKQNPHSLPSKLYGALWRHLKWMEGHPVEVGISPTTENKKGNAIERYKQLVREYYPRHSKRKNIHFKSRSEKHMRKREGISGKSRRFKSLQPVTVKPATSNSSSALAVPSEQ